MMNLPLYKYFVVSFHAIQSYLRPINDNMHI
jgi:hypothetical protein